MSNENEPSRPPAAEMEMVQRLCATGRYLVLVPGDDEMRTLRAMARDLNVGPGEVAIEMLSMGLIVAGCHSAGLDNLRKLGDARKLTTEATVPGVTKH